MVVKVTVTHFKRGFMAEDLTRISASVHPTETEETENTCKLQVLDLIMAGPLTTL